MAKEPDNLGLKLLREIRDKQDDQDKRPKKIETTLENLSESATYSLGLSAHANVRHETMQKKIDEIEKRLQKLEART